MALPPDDWPRLKDVFAGARALPTDERPAYLAEACDGNEALRQEVESLLSSDERAKSFLEAPAVVQGDDTRVTRSLEGQRIGPYQIASRIGAGGMGEVYQSPRHDARIARSRSRSCCPPSPTIPIASPASGEKRRCSRRSIIRTSRRSTGSKTPTAYTPW